MKRLTILLSIAGISLIGYIGSVYAILDKDMPKDNSLPHIVESKASQDTLEQVDTPEPTQVTPEAKVKSDEVSTQPEIIKPIVTEEVKDPLPIALLKQRFPEATTEEINCTIEYVKVTQPKQNRFSISEWEPHILVKTYKVLKGNTPYTICFQLGKAREAKSGV